MYLFNAIFKYRIYVCILCVSIVFSYSVCVIYRQRASSDIEIDSYDDKWFFFFKTKYFRRKWPVLDRETARRQNVIVSLFFGFESVLKGDLFRPYNNILTDMNGVRISDSDLFDVRAAARQRCVDSLWIDSIHIWFGFDACVHYTGCLRSMKYASNYKIQPSHRDVLWEFF